MARVEIRIQTNGPDTVDIDVDITDENSDVRTLIEQAIDTAAWAFEKLRNQKTENAF